MAGYIFIELLMNKQEKFIDYIYSGLEWKDWCEKNKIKRQEQTEYESCWLTKPICPECFANVGKNDACVVVTYWRSMLRVCHKVCRDKYVREMVYECQLIDSDCNDCKHFDRGVMIGSGVFSGRCKMFDKPTIGCPNFCSGMPCFEHRKS